MAINPLIALNTRTPDIAGATSRLVDFKLAANEQEQQKELIDLRKRGLRLEEIKAAVDAQDKASQRRIRNTALASLQLKQALDSGGEEAALRFLQGSKEGNAQLGLDSNETDEAIGLIQEGDLDRLNTMLDNNIMVGEALGLIEQPKQQETFKPVFDDEGQIIGQRSSLSGKVVSDPRAPDDPGVQVNVNAGGDKFADKQAELRAQRINDLVETGRTALATEQNLSQMADLLVEGVQTGAAQPAIKGLNALAQDFGLDLESIAKKAGIENLSNLAGQEEFDRLAKTVIIDGFEKFKGNLNDREVKLAMDAFANLGRSEDANVQGIASLRAAQSIARERALRASQVTSQAEAVALEREAFQSNNVEKFNERREAFEEEIRARMKAEDAEATAAGVPQSAVEGGVSKEMWEAMTPEERKAFQ